VAWINPRLKKGEKRRVVTGIPGKTGIVYTLDARTGEFLWATPTVKQTVVKSIDGATGAVTVNPDTVFTRIGEERLICPNSNGGKNWPAGAYSPLTRMMYMPLQNTCAIVAPVLDKPSLDSLYGLRNRSQIAPGTSSIGSVWAINADTGTVAWKYEQRAGTMSLVATGGGLVFGGDDQGRFRAFDQKTGKVLWEVPLGAPVTGYPVSYAIDGKQYVAAGVGSSLSSGALNALGDVRTGNNNALFVFALPD
jgi:alcohol dehydrogenase (cytochrome c)